MKIAVISTMIGASWGGSEYLWAATAEQALKEGHELIISCYRWQSEVPQLLQLQRHGAILHYRPLLKPGKLGLLSAKIDQSFNRLFQLQPDVLVINQGGTYDPLLMNLGNLLELLNQQTIPYVVICQRNEDSLVPEQPLRDAAISFFQRASRLLFVSEHNWRTVPLLR